MFALLTVFAEPGLCDSEVAVLLSRKIIPYTEALEGLSAGLGEFGGVDLEVFSYEDFPGTRQDLLRDKLFQNVFNLFIAIGPEAARFLQRQLPEIRAPMLYSMVLNPGEVLRADGYTCGVSLSIPVKIQLAEISRTAPSIKKIGLVHDPAHNESFFREAKNEALLSGVEIVPLKVSERKEIPGVLREGLDAVDCLWLIPDRTVISESIVQYIIKEALLRNTPTIGYNKFFYESGAVLSFIFEYRELGRQAADKALRMLSGIPCSNDPPVFHTWVNTRVAEKLGIEVVIDAAGGAEPGP